MGSIYRQRRDFDEAFECLNTSLNMKNKTLAPEHLSFGATFHSLARVYLDINENKKSIEYFLKASETKKKQKYAIGTSISKTR
jgi:tetratricopeptide (TPR) repeat protein